MKAKVGVYNFTCCEGCTIVLVEALNEKFDEWIEKIDFVDFRTLKPSPNINQTDIALVEGAITTEKEVAKLKEIRSKTKKLVAYGAGAATGWPSDNRNRFNAKQLKEIAKDLQEFKQIDKVSPLKRFVQVDDEISGCPVHRKVVIAKIDSYLQEAGL